MEELRRLDAMQRNDYRTWLWLKIHNEWGKAQLVAWAPILRAIERSNENKCALVLKSGTVVTAIVTLEFWNSNNSRGQSFDDALVLLEIDRRNGQPVEKYAPDPVELMGYLQILGLDPYGAGVRLRWEPV